MKKAPVNWINMILFSLTPALALTLVPLYGYYYGYDVFEWVVFGVLMVFCGMSITAGYHRLWSHKAYKAHPVLKALFALGGACALQNSILLWASDHRNHHRFVDDNEHDPYSAKRGFWFSHIGWILRDYESAQTGFSNVQDLLKDPIVQWQHRHYLSLTLFMNIGFPGLIGYYHGDIIAGLLLGGLLRLVFSQHLTYLINSLAHMWGRQPYNVENTARDNPFLALLTYGEGYHNYHHAFQWDYRNGIKWWQYDPTKWLIQCCAWIGLSKDLKRCTPLQIEKAKIELQYKSATEKCDRLNLSDKWRARLEQEYEEFVNTLQLWSEHRQAWYEGKGRQIQETLSHWDQLQLRDRYQEVQLRLKVQRRRWQQLLRDLAEPLPANAQ
jgi:stearoyl-CoA desaturase (delta-9 desaturase)